MRVETSSEPKIDTWQKSNMITIMTLFLHPQAENAMFREKQKFFLQQKSISQI